MIAGAHFLLYTSDADADRAFMRDVLELTSVDAGHGWLIFALPPAEIAVHPSEGASGQTLAGAELHFMTRDIKALVASLQSRGVKCSAIQEARWGSFATFYLPSGAGLGAYQPKHPTAIPMD